MALVARFFPHEFPSELLITKILIVITYSLDFVDGNKFCESVVGRGSSPFPFSPQFMHVKESYEKN